MEEMGRLRNKVTEKHDLVIEEILNKLKEMEEKQEKSFQNLMSIGKRVAKLEHPQPVIIRVILLKKNRRYIELKYKISLKLKNRGIKVTRKR